MRRACWISSISRMKSSGPRMMRALIVIAAVALSSSAALAAEWPSKAVRVVVPFAAGGAADTIGRLYTDALTTAFGKQFYIENRVGGGGLVGTEAVARAEPDGLTLMVSGIPTHVLGPAMNKNVGFDPMRDFTHIAYFGGTPNVLVAHPSLGVASYRDFLALARDARAASNTSRPASARWAIGSRNFSRPRKRSSSCTSLIRAAGRRCSISLPATSSWACSRGRPWP